MKLIFDSNAFDDLLIGTINIAQLVQGGHEIYVTHIQIDEINKCSNEEKRARLFNYITELRPIKIPTESFVVGKSRIGHAKIGDGDLMDEIRNGNIKHTSDALIGEVAIKNQLTLITNDVRLINKVVKLGGCALTVVQFKQLLWGCSN
jgi:predicted nucleic acid-binding protein